MGFIATLKAAFMAITEFCSSFKPLLLKLSQLTVTFIELIMDFFKYKKIRLKRAIEEEDETRKRLAEEQSLKESYVAKAYPKIIEDAWKDRYEYLSDLLKKGEYDKAIILVKKIDLPSVQKIMFDSKMSPEYKATLIIEEMRNTE